MRLTLPAESIDVARAATENGAKHEPVFSVDVMDAEGVVVANVEKTLHIRRKTKT